MLKTKIYSIVIGRLLLVGVLLIIRWLFAPVYFIGMVLFTISETVMQGITSFAVYVKKLNDHLLNDTERKSERVNR